MSTTGLTWFKSSRSGGNGDSCVEVAVTDRAVHIRDSKDTAEPHLAVTRDGWARFVRYAAGS